MTFWAKLFLVLLLMAISFWAGYYFKDNHAKPDQINQNKIKQKGNNNILSFLQNRKLRKKT